MKTKPKRVAKPATKTKPTAKSPFHVATELEALVADEPSDANWMVLEDSLLEHADPRSPLIVAARSKRPDAAALRKAHKALAPRLFGPKHRTLKLTYPEWRGAYLVAARLTTWSRGNPALSPVLADAALDSPATRLLSRLSLSDDLEPGLAIARSLAKRACARSLRHLVLELHADITDAGLDPFDASVLDGLPNLVGFEIRYPTAKIPYVKRYATLEHFAVQPRWSSSLDGLFRAKSFPTLRDLTIDVSQYASDGPVSLEPLRELFAARAAPALEVLEISWLYDHGRPVIEALASSPLLPKLRELHFDARTPLDRLGDIKPAKLGPKFAHLERVTIPKGFAL